MVLFDRVSLSQQFGLLFLQFLRPDLLAFDLALEFLDPGLDGLVILFELRLPCVLLVQHRALRVIRTLLLGRLRISFRRYIQVILLVQLANLRQRSLLQRCLLPPTLLAVPLLPHLTLLSPRRLMDSIRQRHQHVTLQVNLAGCRCPHFRSTLALALGLQLGRGFALGLHQRCLLARYLLRSLYMCVALGLLLLWNIETLHHHFAELGEGLVGLR